MCHPVVDEVLFALATASSTRLFKVRSGTGTVSSAGHSSARHACCRWRQLAEECANAAAELPQEALDEAFPLGRVVLFYIPKCKRHWTQDWQLFMETPSEPSFVTLGAVLRCSRYAGDISLEVLTWEQPRPPKPHGTNANGGSKDVEEEILYERMGCIGPKSAPFPPQLMPTYCPQTLEESKWRITAIAYLPLHAVLAVFPFTAFAGNVGKYAQAVKRQSERLSRKQNQCPHANANGICEKPDGSRCTVTRARQLMATSKRLFEYAQKCLSDQDKGVAFWQLLGLQ
ncbi:unnamed protein product, partial [Mesocestoides corti]|uniref:DUF3506 domain-containing protein n=1 Tax=Mesocestoides corti TaxID=53468 RepID=A0A0R3UDL9_MESCO